MVASMLTGGVHIDHADRLRSGATGKVLPFRVMAPSTLGTFLRSFTWGHVCQLHKALGALLKRVWSLPGAGPGDQPLVIDVDSTICEVSGKSKEGACYGHTRQLGYHPLIAARADTGDVRSSSPAQGLLAEGKHPFYGRDGQPGETGRSDRSNHGAGRQRLLVPKDGEEAGRDGSGVVHRYPRISQRQTGDRTPGRRRLG